MFGSHCRDLAAIPDLNDARSPSCPGKTTNVPGQRGTSANAQLTSLNSTLGLIPSIQWLRQRVG